MEYIFFVFILKVYKKQEKEYAKVFTGIIRLAKVCNIYYQEYEYMVKIVRESLRFFFYYYLYFL